MQLLLCNFRVSDANISKHAWIDRRRWKIDQFNDRRLAIFCLVNCLYILACYIPLDFLPDSMVKEHGISHINAGNIVPIYGMASFVGRLIGGIIPTYMENSALLLTSLCMILLGTSCLGMAFSILYWHFVVCACIYGIFRGMFHVLVPISLVDMFGVESLKDSYGIIMFCSGISTLLGPPMVGWLKVIWATYDYAFIITAGIFYLGATIDLFLLWVHKRDKNNLN